MDDQRDTSTRKSIKGARVPLVHLAVHKTRVNSVKISQVDLHYGFPLPPALATSMKLSLMEGGSCASERWEGSHVHTAEFMGLDGHSPNAHIHELPQFTPLLFSHTSLLSLTNFTKSTPEPYTSPALLHFRFNSTSQSGRFSWRNETDVFLRPPSHLPHQNTFFMRNNWT